MWREAAELKPFVGAQRVTNPARLSVGVLHRTGDSGQPEELKGAPGHGTFGGKDAGNIGDHTHLNETSKGDKAVRGGFLHLRVRHGDLVA